MTKELKDQRIAVMLTPSELEAVDDWSFAHRIRSRGEAIRILIDAGLMIPTLASAVTSYANSYAIKDEPELASGLRTLDKAVRSHFDKLPIARQSEDK